MTASAVASTNGTFTIYDNTASSGTVIFQIEVFSGTEPFAWFLADRYAPRFTTGLYLALDPNLNVNIWATTR